MARYAFHDLTLEVESVGDGRPAADFDRILDELSWEKSEDSTETPALSLSVRLGRATFEVAPTAREVLRGDGFRGLENGDEFCLTDGASVLRLATLEGRGEAWLAPSFFSKPFLLRQSFWVFALLKLLRPSGIYGLHAAGLVAEDGTGVLAVGESGSGKSTLAIALVRAGWRYLSDDAVLLRSRPARVEALALRRHFYVVSAETGDYSDLPLGEERPDSCGGHRTRVGIEGAYPTQRSGECTPRVLLFPRVTRRGQSVLRPLDPSDALGRLIGQSSPQLFDRETMPAHLATLNRLVQQAAAYELAAGIDLRDDPDVLSRLLAAVEGERLCLASSSS
jgi:hypothetical protein